MTHTERLAELGRLMTEDFDSDDGNPNDVFDLLLKLTVKYWDGGTPEDVHCAVAQAHYFASKALEAIADVIQV